MPVLPTPTSVPPFLFRSGNFATIYPPLFRPTPATSPLSERIETPDGDFLDIDYHATQEPSPKKLIILSHGLEGHARKKYILGMAKMANRNGYDAACWTQRGCSEDPNRMVRCYHSGLTEDLHTIVNHCIERGNYREVVLIGFSMGGNQILKYLGEAPERVPSNVIKGIVFSVPCDLSATERAIAMPSRRIYFEYFMRGLRKKILTKAALFPNEVDPGPLKSIKTLRQFDGFYTAPVNGYSDAEDYYSHASCKQFLAKIRIPTLLVNAQDDPFLPKECYPTTEATANPNLWLEMPRYGGHVGFVQKNSDNIYWSEERAEIFLTQTAFTSEIGRR